MRFSALLFWCHGVEWDCYVTAEAANGCGESIVPIGREIFAWNVHFNFLILSYFLNCCISHVIKGNKNGCPCIVEIRGTEGCALATSLNSLAARAGSLTKVQPWVPLISTMHGQPFLTPLFSGSCNIYEFWLLTKPMSYCQAIIYTNHHWK